MLQLRVASLVSRLHSWTAKALHKDTAHPTSVCVTQTLKMLQKAQNPGEGLESSVIRWSYFIVSLCLCLLYFHKNETNCTLVQLTGFNINQTYGMVQCRIWTHKVDKTKVPEIPPRFMCGSKHHVFLHFFAKHDFICPKAYSPIPSAVIQL